MTLSAAPWPRLAPGERIVWQGAPARGLRLTRRDLMLVPFSMVWLSFVIFWNIGVGHSDGAPLPFRLFGLLFLLIGLFFFVGRFLVDAWLRGRTRYVLTGRRAAIERAGPFGVRTNVDLRAVGDVHLTTELGGRGTIRFGAATPLFGFGRSGVSYWVPSLDPIPQFLLLEDADRVFEMVLAARE